MQDSVDDLMARRRDVRVLICGDALLESQANAQVRGSIHDGWVDCLEASRVCCASLAVAAAAIAAMRPDVVLCVGSYLPDTAYFGELARAARDAGAASVFWATEDPYEKDASYRVETHFDVIFTCDRATRPFYDHPRVFHLPLGGCPHRHYVPVPDLPGQQPIDVLFCGVAFANRRELIARLMPSLAGLRLLVIGPGWEDQDRCGNRAGFSNQRVDKARLIELYSQSKIVLNLGRSLDFENARYRIAASTPGPRTFEAAMAGGLQFFHEDTLEIRDYFADDEVPGFSAPFDFDRLLHHYLSAPERRLATARRAQRRAMDAHSYAARAEQMLCCLAGEGLL